VSAAKQKGTAWETALVNFLKSKGLDARRVAQSGMLDTGDIHGISPFVGQAKNYANLADGLRLGVEGAEVQKVRAGEPFGVALVKRARKPVAKGYAVMTVETFADLLVRLRRAETLPPSRDDRSSLS
jgi:hypothetical protein